jgi:hypothetical protein
VNKLLAAVMLLAAAVIGLIGVLWLFLDVVGSEWDYCRDGCVAGWKMGLGFVVVAAALGLAGSALLRRERHGSRPSKSKAEATEHDKVGVKSDAL